MKIITYKNCIDENQKNYLVKENTVEYPALSSLNSPCKIHEIMTRVFQIHQSAEELVYLISVNSKQVPTAFILLTKGTVNTSLVGIREIFIQALLSSAVGIYLCHNHPSQDVEPSTFDIQMTYSVKKAGYLIGIPLYDHLIIARDHYYSFSEHNYI